MIRITDDLFRTIETARRLIGSYPSCRGHGEFILFECSACERRFYSERKNSNHEDDEDRDPDCDDRAGLIPDLTEPVVGGEVKMVASCIRRVQNK